MFVFTDFIILFVLSIIILGLCEKNNSPNFLDKILYNSEFKEENSEVVSDSKSSKSSKSTGKNKHSKPKVELTEDMEEFLDLSSEVESGEFNAKDDAYRIVDEINSSK